MGRQLFKALHNANLIPAEKEVVLDELDEARKQQAEKDRERRYAQEERLRLFRRIDRRLVFEMKDWQLDSGRVIPSGVLRSWVALDYFGQRREWSKWLCAYKETQA